MTEHLFRHADFDILPKRGAYSPVEIILEWQEALVFALERYRERLDAGEMTREQIDGSARLFHSDSAADLKRLLPFVEGDDEAMAHVHRLEEVRDCLRELIEA